MNAKKIIAAIVTILAMTAAVVLSTTHARTVGDDEAPPAKNSNIPYYTCPMHPSVHSDGPGKCQYCGMSLMLSTSYVTGVAIVVGLGLVGFAGYIVKQVFFNRSAISRI